jgi:LCP family protein required for cell wall assembly
VTPSAGHQLPADLSPRPGRTRRRSPLRRGLVWVAGLLSLAVFLVSVGGFVVVQWFDHSVHRVHLTLGGSRPPSTPRGSQNWLLVGTDNTATNDFGVRSGMRSDTTILTHLDADGTTTNLSIPRDALVQIPAYDADGTHHPAEMNKFNYAISAGGPSLLVRTVEHLTNLHIDHYVSVDLDGFQRISQVLDGVEVCIVPNPRPDPDNSQITNINDGFSGFHGVYGPQKVAGAQALAFVRQRHGLPNSDLDRIARQQQFLGSVFREATANHFLYNPVKVAQLVAAIKDSLTLDDHTDLADLEQLAVRLRGLDPGKVAFETVPQRGLEFTDTALGAVTPYEDAPNGIPTLTPTGQSLNIGSVQVIEQPAFDAILARLSDRPVVTPSPPKASPPPSAPAAPKPVAQTVTAASASNRCTY